MVSLCDNQCAGAAAVAKAMADNKTVQSLVLKANTIGDKGP